MSKILIILIVFSIDRLFKIYLINLINSGIEVDFYIFTFLNFFLVWNNGIGFGLMSMQANIFYHILSLIIMLINLLLIYFLFKLKHKKTTYMIALILGGSLGNLFDRAYYYSVPDFIDFHIGNFHWFTFNIADISITIGIIGLIFLEFFANKKKDFINN